MTADVAWSVHLTVNGVEHDLVAGEQTPLIYILRNDLGLVGTRFGCGLQECGCCFVLVDGRVTASCDTPMWTVDGKSVTTVEGLTGEIAIALREGFIEEQAAQCGYCLSGILISAANLLERDPQPTETAVREALDANLCRCGAHNRIVRAVMRITGSV